MSLSLTIAISNVSLVNDTTAASEVLFQINPILGLVVEGVIAFLVCGHFLILTTLTLYRPWNIADMLIFSLSIADTVNAAIPLQMLNIVNNFIGPHLWTRVSCAAFVTCTYTFRIASVCTITLISVDRAILLTRPLQHHIIVTIGRARKAIVAVWLFSIVLAILPFIGVGHSSFRGGYCFYQLSDFGIMYGYIIIGIGVLQLVLVLMCFIAIKITSSKFVKRQSVMAASKQTGLKNYKRRETAGTRQVKQMSFMMAVVVLLYYFSWLPYLLANLYSLVTGRTDRATVILIGFFSLVNALINPILYGKMSPRYRNGYIYIFKKILSMCGGEKPDAAFLDGTRRKGSFVKFSTASTLQSNARKSIDFSVREGKLRGENGVSNHHSTSVTGVEFEGSIGQEKPQEDEQERNQKCNLAFANDNTDEDKGIVNPSHLSISLSTVDVELGTTIDKDESLPDDETFDSGL
ncbi:thyrotropin-releasing hormone receptor-like [Montipora capricornis]|uniref:thyrotropin-releasing hormone receptor-like n=1 Tax=Montipora capricornis TaxID=246305 RepID=UPI0035F20883